MMERNKGFLAEPSKKMLVFSAGLALVACTVVLWGVVGHSGKIVRQNAQLAAALSSLAPEPQWGGGLTREALASSLSAAFPDLEGAQVSFVAPRWAVAHTEGRSLLLAWTEADGAFVWDVLDEAAR